MLGNSTQPVAAQEPQFQEFQSIPTSAAFAWEFFTIGSDDYLAVANYVNGSHSTPNINSKIYRRRANRSGFEA
jgi:hypothetical protein